MLNPVEPPTIMRTTVHLKGKLHSLETLEKSVLDAAAYVQTYVPGFQVLVPAHQEGNDVLAVSIGVTGAGDYLPAYAGNLDIITAAAVKTVLDLAIEKAG